MSKKFFLTHLSSKWTGRAGLTGKQMLYRRYLLFVLIAGCLIYLPGQGHGLYRGTDVRQAEIGREMFESGDWAVPTLNGDVFLEKPPLFFATVALSYKLFGVSEFTARVPAMLSALVSFVGLALLGSSLRDRRLGLVMALFLGADMYYLSWGHEVQLDLFLCAIVIWSLVAFRAAYREEAEAVRTWPLAAFYFLVTAGFMTKGVVGSLVPCLTVISYLVWRRDWRGFWRIRPWLGLIIFVVATAPWHYALYQRAGLEYFEIFYRDNHYYRFISAPAVDLDHHSPWYAYLVYQWHDFLPWSLLFPVAFGSVFRRGFRQWLGQDSFRFILCWLAPSLIFFTISSTKRSIYLLPLYGAYAGVIGTWILWKVDEEDTPVWEKIYIACFAWAMAAMALAVPIIAGLDHKGSWILFILLAALPIAAAVWTTREVIRWRRDPRRSLVPSLAAIYATAVFSVPCMLPQTNSWADHSGPAREIAALTANEPALYCMQSTETERSYLGFYGKRRVVILGLPPKPDLLPGPGQRIPVASVARSKKLIKRRRRALEEAGMHVGEVLRDDNRGNITVLWWVSPRFSNTP